VLPLSIFTAPPFTRSHLEYLLICSSHSAGAARHFFLAVASAAVMENFPHAPRLLIRCSQMIPLAQASFILLLVDMEQKWSGSHAYLAAGRTQRSSVRSVGTPFGASSMCLLGILRSLQILASSGQLFFDRTCSWGSAFIYGSGSCFVIRQRTSKDCLPIRVWSIWVLWRLVSVGGGGVFGSMLHLSTTIRQGAYFLLRQLMTAYKTNSLKK